jgi:predicted type IV restriction endonuclease
MNAVINEIINNIKEGLFINEAAVSQGIIQRILQALDWPIYNPRIVTPEFSLEGGRVDFALCHPSDKPMVFIEVKQIGKIVGAEKQLFEYAFHQGVPMAILTDGAEWQFFLPAEQGTYDDRRVYKLDLLERGTDEIVSRFNRYLNYKNICDRTAIENARKDYKNVAKNREIKRTLPEAMAKLIEESDELLVDLLSEKVESLCGYSPEQDEVIAFLKQNVHVTDQNASYEQKEKSLQKKNRNTRKQTSQRTIVSTNIIGFILKGKKHETNGARDFCIKGLTEISRISDDFFSRYASYPRHGKKRRFVADNKYDLYPGRKDLAEKASYEIKHGWWVGINIGQQQAVKIVLLGCEIAKLKIGKDFKILYAK